MAFKVRSDFMTAYALVSSRGISFFEQPSNEELEPIVAGILIDEKGYPTNTQVIIDASWDEVDMTLTIEPDGSWELV